MYAVKFTKLFLFICCACTTMSYAQCVSDTNALVITQNTTWSANQTITTDIFINSGVTLTISAEIQMYDHGNIYVDRGAELMVNGGTITKAPCAEAWGGIQVYGNSTQQQTSTLQGTLTLTGNETLSYAHTAISNGAYKCGFILDKVGGIINATNSFFYNNARDVQFGPYTFTNSTRTLDYNALFQNCEFKKDKELALNYSMANITMWGVYGVKFKGCTFTYEDTASFPNSPAWVSSGIYAVDASFSIENYNQINSQFNGYERCILATNSQRPDKPITIQDAQFYPKGVSVALVASSNFEISSNYFHQGWINRYRTTVNPNPAGGTVFVRPVLLDACSNFDIVNNEFFGLPTQISNLNCIGITDCYTGVNTIYRNKLSNSYIHSAAIDVYGKNQSAGGLEGVFITCNEFNNNIEDIRVWAHAPSSNPAAYRGIPENQGYWDNNEQDITELANNVFSKTWTQPSNAITKKTDYMVAEVPSLNYFVNYVRYTHSDALNDFTPLAHPTFTYGNMGLITIPGYTYSYEEGCPTPPVAGSINLSEAVATLSELDENFNDVNTTIITALDAGSPAVLESEILSSTNGEYDNLYLTLMEMAPFVSIRNLLNVLSLPDFPQYALKNILIANPHGYRSAEVKEALYTLETPFSDTDIAEIMETQHIMTAYDELKASLTAIHVKRAASVRNIVRYANSEYGAEFDLETFLLNRQEPSYHYALVDKYVSNGEVGEAAALLEEIAFLPRMDEKRLADLELLKDYYNVVFTALEDNRQLDSLTEEEEDDLLALYLNGNYIASKKALGLLILNNEAYGYMGFTTHEEDLGKKAQENRGVEPVKQEEWNIFPNPAYDYAVLRWNKNLLGVDKITIEVFNLSRVSVLKEVHTANEYAYVLRTDNWSNGVYTVKVSSNAGVHTVKKLMIAH